jgi:WD40 repeat protein
MKALKILTLSVLFIQTLSRSVLPVTRKLLRPLDDLTSQRFILISDSWG